jgi:hypothetical protein
MSLKRNAIYLSWDGYVDTKLKFSQFFAGDHTMMAWFMPQYPFAFEGPIFSDNSSTSNQYCIGQADYRKGNGGWKKKGDPVFMVKMGGKEALYLMPALKAKEWQHIAVVRKNNVFKFYLNGVAQQPFKKDSEDNILAGNNVEVAPTFVPSGILRFGRSGPAQPNRQAFGLLDDVAVFDKALTLLEIQAIRDQKKLDGKESGLLAGWVFDENPIGIPSILKTWHKRSKRAYLVPVSANRNNQLDAQRFNDPMFMNSQVYLRLPFPPAQEWRVTQGFNNSSENASHNGSAAFTWDFVLTDGSMEPPISNSAAGHVVAYLPDGEPVEKREPNIVITKIGEATYLRYLHLKANSLSQEISGGTWDSDLNAFVIPQGKQPWLVYYSFVGKVGKGANHLHMGAENSLKTSVTIPIAFSDYEVKQDDGNWKSVARGIPQSGEVVRNPPTPKFTQRSLQVNSAVARSSNQLDVLATDTNGRVWIAHWQPNTYEKNWDRWRPVLADIGIADFGFSVASFSAVSPVSVVARDANKLDVFMAGQDGKTYTGAWDQDVADGLWRGWWNILQGAIPPDGTVTAVSRAATKLDVFHVSNDGKVYTAAWDKQTADGEWRGWWPIKVIAAKPGSPVAAIARTPNKLDIFVTGKDGKVYTAAWDKQAAKGEWQGWWPIGDLSAPSGAPVSVVSRGPDNLDIFVVGNDSRVYTTAWAKHAAGGKWQSWRLVKTLTAKPGTPVAVVSREPHNLDIFTLGSDNKVYTAAWDKHVADGQWRGWWPVGDKSAKSKSAVAAVSRSPLKLDIFIVGSDGKIHTAAWDPKKAKGEWQGWWSIGS